MKAITKYLMMMIAMLALSVSFSSCGGGDDDDPAPADAVVGTYSGTISNMYSGEEGTGYVTLTRASDTTVFLTLFKSEALAINVTGSYELNVADNGNGTYRLSSATTYQISGSVSGKTLDMTAVISGKTCVFNGTK